MKAVVLARGLGTRMKAEDPGAALREDQAAIAATGVKALVPLGARPFLDYGLSALADAGCRDICLVVGPDSDGLRDRYRRVAPPTRFRIHFAVQEKALGTGNAVLAAREFASSDPFLMVNSDNYYPVSVLRRLVEMQEPGTVLFSPEGLAAKSNIEPSRILAFAFGVIGADGCLDALVEKPTAEQLAAIGSSRHVSMNCWRFPSSIFDFCARLEPSVRGELELSDAINAAIASGLRLRAGFSDDGVLDLSRRGDIHAVRARLADVPVQL